MWKINNIAVHGNLLLKWRVKVLFIKNNISNFQSMNCLCVWGGGGGCDRREKEQ